MLQRNSKETVPTLFTNLFTHDVQFLRIFWDMHTHHCQANSTTFQDLLHFPGPNSFFRTFQVLEILQTQFQDFPGVETLLQVREVNRVKQLATSLSNSHAIWDHTVLPATRQT